MNKNLLDGQAQSVTAASLISKWKAMMSRVNIGASTFFNSFVDDTDSRIECTLCKFADYNKLLHKFDILEGRDAFQRNLDRLERCLCEPHEIQKGRVQGPAPEMGQS